MVQVMLMKILTCLILVQVGALALIVKRECIPQKNLTFQWEGSRVDLVFWLPKDDADLSRSTGDAPLSLFLQYTRNPISDDTDTILVGTTGARIIHRRNEKTVDDFKVFNNSLEAGWNVLSFSANYGIEIRKANDLILSTQSRKVIAGMEVRGSYVAVNCHQSPLIWLVDDAQEVYIPFLPSKGRNEFTLYSNIYTKPVLSFGPSENEKLQLGWDGTNLADQILYEKDVQSPMPTFKDHRIVISCKPGSKVTCQVLVGETEKCIKEIVFNEVPKNFSISVGSKEKLVASHEFLKNEWTNLENARSDQNKVEISIPGNNNSDGGTAGSTVAIVLLVVLVLGTAVGYVIYTKYIKKKISKSENDEEAALITKENELLRAIERNRLSSATELLETTEVEEFHMIKAHYLGRKDLLEVIRRKKGKEEELPSSNIIKRVYKELELGINEVFKAAKMGRYKGALGVKCKLEDHELPGTITDEEGRSVLHYMVQFCKGEPLWLREDIVNFLNTGNYYINAVDHMGNTALQMLASNTDEGLLINWDGGQHYIKEVLLDMAKLLTQKGANPSLRNLDHKSSVILAKENGLDELQDFLQKEYQDSEESCKAMDPTENFNSLIDASRKGENQRICDLLKIGAKLLPMYADEDPLVEAILNNHRDTVLLLLGAGAQICNRQISDQTALEIANNTMELPACHAAIVRKVFHDRLRTEKEKLPAEKEELKLIISSHMRSIKEFGTEAEGLKPKVDRDQENEEYSKRVRQLLVTAASYGLSLTCLLLGQRDVFLHTRPAENKPLSTAIQARHYKTQSALCRDLAISPFTFNLSECLPTKVLADMYKKEIKIIGNHMKGENHDVIIDHEITDKLGCYEDVLPPDGEMPAGLLYIIAKDDLVVILDKILKNKEGFDINQTVEEFSGSTMLHIAAMHGSIRVIEYLVYKRASLGMKTIGNFTAAHLAAIRGHKECYHYIRAWVKQANMEVEDDKCDIGLTASELMCEYEKLCMKCGHPLISHTDALIVKNETRDDKKTKRILCKKGEVIGIRTFDDLVKYTKEKACEEDDMEHIQKMVMDGTENLINSNNKFVRGKLIPMGSLTEKNEVLDITHVGFSYEIEERLSKSDSINMITNVFPQCIEDAMNNFKAENQKLSLVPPFFTHVGKGVHIRWAYYDGSLKLLTSTIVPTVMLDDSGKQYYYEKHDLVSSTHDVDQKICDLQGDEKEAWLICRMLRKLTLPCWWSPTFKSQYYPKPWHTWSLGVPGLAETKMKKLFMSKDGTNDLLSRIKRTFEDLAAQNPSGKWVPTDMNNAQSPSELGEKLSVCGILQYLDYLNNAKHESLI